MADKSTILLVDDEVDALDPLLFLLEEDYVVHGATSGEQALSTLESERVDVIVADQRMPGMTGVELLARVRELHPDVVRLILTAYTDFEAMLEAINQGRVYRYIIKPWDEEDMRVTIRQALEWKGLREQAGELSAELLEANRSLAERNRQLREAREAVIEHEKLAAVGRFASEMAHEMKNHLQVILGVNDGYCGIQEAERRRIVEEQTEMLVMITADIRDFALGATMPFSPRPTDPLVIVEQVRRACRHHPAFRDMTIEVSTGRRDDVRMDGRQMKHLLFNMLKNAALASRPGDAITVAVDVSDDLVLRVVDRGHGIPADIRERIWEPFFTTASRGGAGLGLSICRQVVENHRGSIEIEETPGGGTTFVIRLPG